MMLARGKFPNQGKGTRSLGEKGQSAGAGGAQTKRRNRTGEVYKKKERERCPKISTRNNIRELKWTRGARLKGKKKGKGNREENESRERGDCTSQTLG